MSTMQSDSGFSMFYERWMSELEGMLHQLMKALERPQCSHSELEALVFKARSVYAEYYVQKWRSLEDECDNILPFFSPVWLSPLEKSRYWLAGWKPSAAFRLMDSLVKRSNMKNKVEEVLDEGQKRRIGELKEEVKAEEEVVEMENGSAQASVAGRTILELAELGSGRGEEMVEEALKRLLGELKKVMRTADCLRWKTMEGILGILSTKQSVEFLAAACMLQIQMRNWGIKNKGNAIGLGEVHQVV